MKVAGLAWHHSESSVAVINNHMLQSAVKEEVFSNIKGDRSFPTAALRWSSDRYEDFDYIACTKPQNSDEVRTRLKSFSTARIATFDYKQALTMSALCTKDWQESAILLVDAGHFALGVYKNCEFTWLHEVQYPNTPSLFFSASAKLLGFDPLLEEVEFAEYAQSGQPTFTEWLLNYIISVDGTLNANYTTGMGVAARNADLAKSVQEAFTRVILHNLGWLKQHTKCDNLVVVGRAAQNYFTNTAIVESGMFANVTFQRASKTSISVGLAALMERCLWSHNNLGPVNKVSSTLPDDLVLRLLSGAPVSLSSGPLEFFDTTILSRNTIFVPYQDLLPTLDSARPPIYICNEIDYPNIYNTSSSKDTDLYLATPLDGSTPRRVFQTTLRKNAFASRLLELLKKEGIQELISII